VNFMNNIAIIPARGGSKRIHKKNIKHFSGVPIISYSINAAIESGLFQEVLVSTDDFEIASIAEKFGATVPFMRSSENSNDFATTSDVVEEVIKELKNQNKFFDNICCIYSCAPFIKTEYLTEAYNLLLKNSFDTVFPIIPYSTKIQRALRINNKKIEMVYPEFEQTRSQDLEISYYDAGQFYWIQEKMFSNNKKIYTNNSGAIILDELSAHDIDSEIDWKIAEIKYSLLK
jgi:pseudaminic acid cytidylyltransferase